MIYVLVSGRKDNPALIELIQIRVPLLGEIKLVPDQERIIILSINSGSNLFILKINPKIKIADQKLKLMLIRGILLVAFRAIKSFLINLSKIIQSLHIMFLSTREVTIEE